MQCPICGAESSDLSSGEVDGLVVLCKHCGEYEVVDGALDRLLRLEFEDRVMALEAARAEAPADARPKISGSRLVP